MSEDSAAHNGAPLHLHIAEGEGARVGCGACGSSRPPAARFSDGRRPGRKAWLVLEAAINAHGGVAIADPFAGFESLDVSKKERLEAFKEY